MRTCLSPGAVITLTCDGASRQFQIDQVIGDGANCIAYAAHRADLVGIAPNFRIKECYPYDTKIERQGTKLVWTSNAERAVAFDRLRNACSLTNELRNTESVGNSITAAELYEGNGTLYSVMEVNHAKTYDKDSDKDLHSILETMRVLTEIVGNLHEQGYLHLDIKPSNFLVNHRPNTNVWLFDVDSLTAIDDLMSGAVKTTSFSQQWAAPEQIRGQTDKLCPATDLYAIGTILFEKVMGKPVSNEDTGLFSEWAFDSELFENVNPKIKRILREIFKKTLSVSTKRRYQSASELTAALEQACSITVEGRPYLIGNCPPSTNYFIGRTSELAQIENAFSTNCKTVFLYGEGGIGKSILALTYADRYQQKFDTVLFSRYTGSLERLIDDIEIQNVEYGSSEHRKTLRRLLDDRTLLIIDNFNVELDQDDYLEELLKFKSYILFTTRTDFSTVLPSGAQQIEVGQLHQDELTQLFCNASGNSYRNHQFLEIHKLLKAIGNNTYATELLGLQIAASGCSLDQLSKKMTTGFASLNATEKVRTKKDGHVLKRNLLDIFRALYQTAELNDSRQQVLRNMYLLRFMNIDRISYSDFTLASALEIDALNDMIEIGWVRKHGSYFVLHPIVEELVKIDLRPNSENCAGIYAKIKTIVGKCVNSENYDEAEQYEFESNCNLLCSFFSYADFSIEANRRIAIDWLLGLIESECVGIEPLDDYYFGRVYDKLLDSITINPITKNDIFSIRYILFFAALSAFAYIYYGDKDDIQRKHASRERNLTRTFTHAIAAADELSEVDRELALDKLYAAISSQHTLNLPEKFIRQCFNERPQALSLSAYEKEQLGLPLSEEDKETLLALSERLKEYTQKAASEPWPVPEKIICDEINSLGGSVLEGESAYNLCEDLLEHLYGARFMECEDKLAFIKQIASKSVLPLPERAKRIWYCTNMIFGSIHREVLPYTKHVESINWDIIKEILETEEELLIHDEYHPTSYEEHEEWEMYTSYNTVNQVITSAALGDLESYIANMEILLADIGRDVHWYLQHDAHWSRFVSLRDYQNAPFWYVFNGLMHIHKASWILPYLIIFSAGWEAYAKEKDVWDTAPFFSVYRMIVDCADRAYFEDDIPQQYQLDYLDISLRYQRYMDEITGTTYTLRPKED